MTDHPITPPPELVEQWLEDGPEHPSIAGYIATQAARWGADQELEACLDEIYKGVGLRIIDHGSHRELLCSDLRWHRRPKPPSLKEQALKALPKRLNNGFMSMIDDKKLALIRRALEALDD